MSNLPDSISSAQDLQAVIIEIREYAKWHSHTSIKQQVGTAVADSTPPQMSAAAIELLNDLGSQANKPGAPQLKDLLDNLTADLSALKASAPNITITLAAPAHASLKRSLVAWCRQNIEPDVLVSFTFNSTILGGMVIRCGSHVYDWSFRRQIMANYSKFPQYLRETGVTGAKPGV